MKKALVVANTLGLITSFVLNDIQMLRAQGYIVQCACNTTIDDARNELPDGVEVFHVDFPVRSLVARRLWTCYGQLRRILDDGDFSLIHCHTTIASAITRECARRHSDATIVYTSHGLPYYRGVSWWRRFVYKTVENHCSRHTDAIVTICGEDYRNAQRLSCQRVYYIPGVGVNVKAISSCATSREAARQRIGIDDEERVVVLSVGEINENKNHRVVIQAISQLDDLDMTYVICGRELQGSAVTDQLMDLAANLGVDVRLLGYRSDIPEICRAANIGALPSLKEGLGLAGVEMLASGLPVVGAARQGVRDYVVDGVTGYLCDPNSADSFATGIRKCIALSRDAGTRSLCVAQAARFDVKESRAAMRHVYSELL